MEVVHGYSCQKASLLYCVLTKSRHVYCTIESSILHCIAVHLGPGRPIEVSFVSITPEGFTAMVGNEGLEKARFKLAP